MRVEFDLTKNLHNIRTRGLSFDLVVHLDWETALAFEDTRKDYGERRFRVLGMISTGCFMPSCENRPRCSGALSGDWRRMADPGQRGFKTGSSQSTVNLAAGVVDGASQIELLPVLRVRGGRDGGRQRDPLQARLLRAA